MIVTGGSESQMGWHIKLNGWGMWAVPYIIICSRVFDFTVVSLDRGLIWDACLSTQCDSHLGIKMIALQSEYLFETTQHDHWSDVWQLRLGHWVETELKFLTQFESFQATDRVITWANELSTKDAVKLVLSQSLAQAFIHEFAIGC